MTQGNFTESPGRIGFHSNPAMRDVRSEIEAIDWLTGRGFPMSDAGSEAWCRLEAGGAQ